MTDDELLDVLMEHSYLETQNNAIVVMEADDSEIESLEKSKNIEVICAHSIWYSF